MSLEKNFMANLFYHGRIEQQFSGNILDQLRVNLHVLVDEMRAGSSGNIVDVNQNEIVYSCSYHSSE